MSGLILRVRPLRFEFEAVDPISFAPGRAANVFRGAFGEILRKEVSAPAYARMFAPRASVGPSGLGDPPRPFVLRAASLDGRRFGAGERFTLDVNVFDPNIPALDYFRLAFEQLRVEGLGRNRPRIALLEANELPVVEAILNAPRAAVSKIRLSFLTPTELKIDGETLREPRFDAVLKRARDRVIGLIRLYQSELVPDAVDLRGLGDRAEAVRMPASNIQQEEYKRRSSRTGQVHSLGGFTGEAEYEGDLTEFLPYLEAAWWTGVGRLTVWGNGMIRTECAPDTTGIQ